jgi:hypothetical protein
LRSQIEDREAQLGRKLNDNEVGDLLRKRGRPLMVANRYLPQHSLIGPVLFPIYTLVLKIAAACFIIPRIFVLAGFFLFDPKTRAAGLVATALHMWSEIWFGTFVVFGIVTLVFAILDQTQNSSRILEKWDPLQLPKVRETRQIPRLSSLLEIAFGMVGLLWLADIAASSQVLNLGELRIGLTPTGREFAWLVTGLAALGVGMSFVNLFRPYWTRARMTVRVVQDLISATLFGLAAKAIPLVDLSGPKIPGEKAVQLSAGINGWLVTSLAIMAVVCTIIAFVDLVRLFRFKPNGPGLIGQVSGAMQNRSC